jgi:hypothetical protein
LEDLYISVWFRLDPSTLSSMNGTKSSLLLCQSPTQRAGNSLEIYILRDLATGEFKIRGGVLNVLQYASIDKVQKLTDMTGWNHVGMYIDTASNLDVSLNSDSTSRFSIGSANVF